MSQKLFLWYPMLIAFRLQATSIFVFVLSFCKDLWEKPQLICCHSLLLSVLTFSCLEQIVNDYVRTLRNPFKQRPILEYMFTYFFGKNRYIFTLVFALRVRSSTTHYMTSSVSFDVIFFIKTLEDVLIT